ncbi:alpha-1,2-fucosyltransferase [Flavobacterium sandaracinum]|uniref:Alpha-1,2-fucosyltransferase n=1 Tax=Flavobacterium sandaracinum TaxID=2541733 RepID=A0A4R5D023_9FLAO|nr:alpha-1,2-fucosyltransferase [Flavobacterium sandaracinum]TDE04761.1 alpha-1,2-fucosyltransferase [Flavobacterium sandaracinum]
MKIIVSGGLGNQMFQYALYLSLKEKGKNVKLDTSLFNFAKMHNGYELERCFGLNIPKVKVTNWGILKLRTILKYKFKSIVYNDKLNYDEQVFKSKCTYLNGSWQSEMYFKQIENSVREAFVFKNIDVENQKVAKEIHSTKSVSLHIRQGDYLENSIYAGVCTEEYYLNAINSLIHEIGNEQNTMFYVFSDDKAFANQFINKLNLNARLVDFNNGVNSYKDMYLMSLCKHNIIANSSFSWWGAWLNNNPNKIVIAPNRWFGNGHKESYKDIVPKSWIKI